MAVRRACNGNIVVVFDRANGAKSPNGIPDLVYRFAPLKEDADRYAGASFNLKRAQVFFRWGRLAVVSKENRVVLSLSVEEIEQDDAGFATYGDRARDMPNTVRLDKGIGLALEVTNLSADSLRAAGLEKASKISGLAALVDLEKDFVIRKGARLADEGGIGGGRRGRLHVRGKGATQCSINCPGTNGCGTTCGLGYWACCNCPNSCSCQEKTLAD